MLEEEFARYLINNGAGINIGSLIFGKNFNFKGSLGPFKADFTDIVSLEALEEAVREGEGYNQQGKDALKLLKKIAQARADGLLESYTLVFTGETPNCDMSVLLISNDGLAVSYEASYWQNTLQPLCEKPCPHQNVCPSYQAHKAGKDLIFKEE